ncbi:MAG TPA: tRNA adenosine(34) deaminase TadA [Candidatus Omnitrophota bacterium]|nr:tRNA adenosine(34) deaminase TadA [Candidatus Omnitrophota bacterium]HQL41846.1 tRNA adenosine(34) deaminase TadA [Candidatus Omnitrophota bacterium]
MDDIKTPAALLTHNDEYFMREALRQAKIAFDADEVPIGAVVVHQNRIVARAHNQVEVLKDPTAHAEIVAITQAANTLSSKWLNDCKLYVTIEPCSMCAGALVLARIKTLYFGAKDPKAGACGSCLNIANHTALNHRMNVVEGILAQECGALISDFFKRKRIDQAKFN